MHVAELMTRDPATVSPESTCGDAAALMKREDCGSLPVVGAGKLAGIVTDRDIVIRVVAAGKDPKHVAVSEVMTADPLTVRPDATAEHAARLMAEKQVRRLPVTDNGRLVGLLVIGQLARHESTATAGETLKDVSRPVAH